jgi:concentrative nucleoside transporter, CNT family
VEQNLVLQLQSALGLFVFLSIAFLFSNNKSKVSWSLVIKGMCFQILLALLVLGVPRLNIVGPLKFIFIYANELIMSLLSFTNTGSEFLLGPLASSEKSGFIIVFQVLPIIIFLSSLMTVLYHLGIMQWVVNSFAQVMLKLLNISGAESLAAAANVFVGQTEAPLIIRPYLKKMTSSELFSVMTGGMATIAGSVMAAYVGLLKDHIPNIGGHLLTASILSAPAALVIAKIMVPETQIPETLGRIPKEKEKEFVNVIEAAASGASDGMKLAVNVAAMLLAFVALIALIDACFIKVGSLIGFENWGTQFVSLDQVSKPQLSISLILSWLFQPIAFFIGIPFADLGIAGSLIGKKIVFNEFIAYLDLEKLSENMNPRTSILLSYALCGFANFSSIAIQIGGIGPMIPERKKELAHFGIRSIIGGSLAAFLTACLAGLLI